MKCRLRICVWWCAWSLVATTGCQPMFSGPAEAEADAGQLAGGTDANTSADGGGYFAEVGGDPLEIRPEEVEIDEEGEETGSHFRAVQVDPVREDSAGPKFVRHYDFDQDGLPDLLTAWNQSQPVQIHLQRRDLEGNVSMVAVNLGGTGPIALVAGVEAADFDQDGWLDVAVLSKATGAVGICPKPGEDPPFEPLGDEGEVQLLFNPGDIAQITDGDAWEMVRLARSRQGGRRDKSIEAARIFPEFNGYSGLAVGEIDGINGPDVVVAYNPIQCEFYGDDPPINRILFLPNPGGSNTRNAAEIPWTATAAAGPDQVLALPADPNPDPETLRVTLSGLQSFDSLSSGVGYFWEQIGGPAVALSGANTANPEFIAPAQSTILTFRLTVMSGSSTDFDIMNVIVGAPANLPPTAFACCDETIIPDASDPASSLVDLLGGGVDPNGDVLTFNWTQVGGAPVALSGGSTATPSFEPPEIGGDFRFRVTVSDGEGMDSALVTITLAVWAPIRMDTSLARAGDVKIMDVDFDGDNDILHTFPNQITSNVSWMRNPTVPHDEVSPGGASAAHGFGNWQVRPVGQVDTEADVITLGDIDLDGFDDVLVRSQPGGVVQWFRHPGAADREPIFPPSDVVPDRFNFPWQVYTIAEYDFRLPAGIAIGDITGDGFNEVIVGAGGVVYWYDGLAVDSIYDQWAQNFVIDDTKANKSTDDPNDPDFEDSGTVVYGLDVLDLDGDGFGDVFGTLDRRVMSGLADDTLLWFRNTLGRHEKLDEEAE